MSKNRQGNFFEDFMVGTRLCHPTPRTVTEADQRLYIGLTGSRDPLASATTAAQACGFAGSPLESFLVFNIAFGKTVPEVSLNAVANLGYAELRFLAPVFSGDTLSVHSEVIGLRGNSNGKSGVVYTRSTARNQHGAQVLSWVRWVMVHRREALAGPAAAPVLPALHDHVPASELAVAHFAPTVAAVAGFTGRTDFWEDYRAGERIDHFGAMTLNDSDHSIATRLYQNTAKAHFDGHRMASSSLGQRLVYGGHVISICHSLAYDGLENVLSVLAIHAGSHVAPTFADDTLCCATTVLEATETSNPAVGALRLRTVGAKNVDSPSSIVFAQAGESGARPAHAASVVLDLDYTVAIPKRPL